MQEKEEKEKRVKKKQIKCIYLINNYFQNDKHMHD